MANIITRIKIAPLVVSRKLGLLFLVVAGLYFAKAFLMPLCIGGILATLYLPFCNWMQRKKISAGLAVSICLLSLLLFMAGLAILIGWQIGALTKDATLVQQKFASIGDYLQAEVFHRFGISAGRQVQIMQAEQPSFGNLLQKTVGSLAYIFTNFILILAYLVMLLYYRIHLTRFILYLTPTPKQMEVKQVLHRCAQVAQQYLVGLAKMIGCLWIMYSIGFGILGVQNFIFFAILCGILEIVPFVGNMTGTALTVAVAAVHGASAYMLVGIIITYGTVQFIQGWVLEPLILGPQVKINPLFTVVALVLGQLIWGIPGIVLAIPITAIIKIICDHVDALQPYGFLIGPTTATTTATNDPLTTTSV